MHDVAILSFATLAGSLTQLPSTVIRRGLPVRVIIRACDLDRAMLTILMQDLYRRKLDQLEVVCNKRLDDTLFTSLLLTLPTQVPLLVRARCSFYP